MNNEAAKHSVYAIVPDDPRAEVILHKGAPQSFFTGSVLYFGEGADLDYVLLVDVFKTTGHDLMEKLFSNYEVCGNEEYMGDHLDRRAFRSPWTIDGKTVNYIVTADKAFYDAMATATVQVLSAEANGDTKYRDKLTRVNLFRAIRGEAPITPERWAADQALLEERARRRSLASITSGPSYY